MNNRERLSSRLGFILLSAGCAIGCGNVWKYLPDVLLYLRFRLDPVLDASKKRKKIANFHLSFLFLIWYSKNIGIHINLNKILK